jgi:hypothetical protein
VRAVFSLVGLVLVVAIIGLVAKKQLAAVAPTTPLASSSVPASASTPQDQVQAMKQAAEAALQTPRPVDDDAK